MGVKLPAFVLANPLKSWSIPVQSYNEWKFVIFSHMDQVCIRLIMITITIGRTKILISHMVMVTNKLTLDQRSSSATLAQQRGTSSLFPRGTPSSQPHLLNIPIATSMVTIIPDNCRRRGRRRQCKFFWPV